MRTGRSLRMALLLAAVLLSCKSQKAVEGPIRLGIITSLSCNFATFGAMEGAGYKVAAEEGNKAHIVLRPQLELVIQDHVSNPKTALAAGENMVPPTTPLRL